MANTEAAAGTPELPLLIQEYRDLFDTVTFGPYAQANSGNDAWVELAWLRDKDVLIDNISWRVGTLSGAATAAYVCRSTKSNPSSTPSTGQTINTTAMDFSGGTVYTIQTAAIDGASTNNFITAGEGLFLYFNTTATSMAGLYITIRYRERKR